MTKQPKSLAVLHARYAASDSNLLLFGSTKAPSNGAGRPKTITPPVLTALYDLLALNPCMRLEDMAAFLGKEFDVDVTRFSISRALIQMPKLTHHRHHSSSPLHYTQPRPSYVQYA